LYTTTKAPFLQWPRKAGRGKNWLLPQQNMALLKGWGQNVQKNNAYFHYPGASTQQTQIINALQVHMAWWSGVQPHNQHYTILHIILLNIPARA
jgi:hypothetical protein